MREIISLNEGWNFTIDGQTAKVNLPHTWNNLDGQDGRDGYKRGIGVYERAIGRLGGDIYLEILAANSAATVTVNGVRVAAHRGGYSAFWANITDRLGLDANMISIVVSNAPDDEVYPTMADFTFYGGLYRGINLIKLSPAHFDITQNGKGVFITPEKAGSGWQLKIKAKTNEKGREASISAVVYDKDGGLVGQYNGPATTEEFVIPIENPVLWQGVENPYLYTVKCRLVSGDECFDEVEVETAFREIVIDKDKGCFLNGRHIKLKGVSRHQDREDMGNALTPYEQEEDIAIIRELGANSVRLAHYQHNDYFYTLCDRAGLLVWAEVPVISRFHKKRQENAKSQLTELILQAYNHPSIFCWSIANEISIAGAAKGLEHSLRELNTLAKKLDGTRYTAMAQVTMCSIDSPLNGVTDILGYNHYYGWYVGMCADLDNWLDKWRAENPDKCLSLSEYGAEGILRYQGSSPVQGDYSEGYQAVYHENYIKSINSREWLWGSYVWNMFDFGSAARNEGGVRGRNNKGLVTFDRRIKKDAFYLYKAYWSDEEFVYITGRRYTARKTGDASVKVYSNAPTVTLTVNGSDYTQTADKVFVFNGLTLEMGDNTIVAKAGNSVDTLTVMGVAEEPSEYKLPKGEASFVRNWFDDAEAAFKPDHFSVEDKVGELLGNDEVKVLLKKFAGKKADSKLLLLLKPFKVKTLLKLPILNIDEETVELANKYLQTIKK